MITAVKLISKLIYSATCWPSLFRSQLTLNGRWCDCSTKDTTTRTGAILAIFSILFCSQFWQFPVLILAILATFSIFFGTKSDRCFTFSVTLSVRYSSCWDLSDVTLACDYAWVAAAYFMGRSFLLLMGGQKKIHVVDSGTKQKPCYWCRNKTKGILLMLQKNKGPATIIGAVKTLLDCQSCQ